MSQDGENEGLGIPKGMTVIAGSGEALGRDGATLGARPSLQDVEEREANRLLELGITVELHVGPLPELIQVLPLVSEEALPARQASRFEGRHDLVPQRGDGPVA